MRRAILITALLSVVIGSVRSACAEDYAPPDLFSAWSPETFARAKRERRIIVLTVSTSWCHWCHVMKRDTYGDPRVLAVLKRAFLPVDVDADARPDLAERFRNYRWPATAFLTPEGEAVLALRGHRYPDKFLEILADVERRVAGGGPYPGFQEPSKAGGPQAATDREGLARLRDRLREELDEHWDEARAGWGTKQKYPLSEPVEYGLFLARVRPGDREPLRRSLATLRATENLFDPVWGGVYQYGVNGSWTEWHPEKIASVNAGAMTTFALAARLGGGDSARFAGRARDVVRWLRGFMTSPDGSYYASQDADAPRLAGERYYRLSDRERRRYGIPRVGGRVYAHENGILIQGLVAIGRSPALRDAKRAAWAIVKSHRMADGAFRHEAGSDHRLLYLLDQVSMGRACLALYLETGFELWLDYAMQAANAMERFELASGGFANATADPAAVGVFRTPLVSLVPNAEAARFLLDMSALFEDPRLEARALAAIRAVGTERQIDRHWRNVAGLLLAVEQALVPFARIEIAGPEGGDTSALVDALVEEAMRLAREHPLVFWTRRVSPDAPMALVCGKGYCSDPVRSALELDARVRAVLAREP